MLLAVDGYRYGDKAIDRSGALAEIRAALPSLRSTVVVPYLRSESGAVEAVPGAIAWSALLAETGPLAFDPVPFDHPLYVLFSSGTTGLPKPIVHGHGGILLEHLKALALHTDLGPADRFCWFTTTGWMMWNYLVSGLAAGSTLVLFDGNPAWPDLSTLWRLAADDRDDVPRRQRAVPHGLPRGRPAARARPGPGAAARRRVDGRAAAGGGLPVGARGGVGRDPAGLAERRHGPVHRVPRAVAARAGLGGRDQLPDARRAGRGVRSAGPVARSASRASS